MCLSESLDQNTKKGSNHRGALPLSTLDQKICPDSYLKENPLIEYLLKTLKKLSDGLILGCMKIEGPSIHLRLRDQHTHSLLHAIGLKRSAEYLKEEMLRRNQYLNGVALKNYRLKENELVLLTPRQSSSALGEKCERKSCTPFEKLEPEAENKNDQNSTNTLKSSVNQEELCLDG